MIIGDTPDNNGFRYSIEYFLSRGYKKSELYGTQYWFADIPHMGGHFFAKENVMYLRKFVEAVLKYTGSKKIDIIAHSQGVLMSRRLIKGGILFATDEPTVIGLPLTNRVDTYIGIAGPNMGILECLTDSVRAKRRICNSFNGNFPGT